MASSITSPAHTPGPWHTFSEDAKRIIVRDEDHHWLATIRCDEQADVDSSEAEDNARLIAAAPDLLEHLTNIVEMAHSVSGNWESGDLAQAVRSLERIATSAQAAIAKAEGNIQIEP